MRWREIKRHAVQSLRDSGIIGELFPSVRRKAFHGLSLQCLKQYGTDGLCCLLGCFASYQIPALSIYQRDQTGFSCLSHYGIILPERTATPAGRSEISREMGIAPHRSVYCRVCRDFPRCRRWRTAPRAPWDRGISSNIPAYMKTLIISPIFCYTIYPYPVTALLLLHT